ncbi:MAG: DUF4340 domain-containing protein [Salinivirgaceae bacterium]|nr:DUF4340 domain-containing protein [Salinivirgaceae bacterium]
MNKKKIQIVVLFVLVLTAIYFISTNSKTSIKKEFRDFAVEDTSTVDKIFLVDKASEQILLEKMDGYWTVNKDYTARQDLVDLVLKTLLRMKVKEPVANAASKNIIKNIAVKSTKVEVYQQGELTKTFYVGGPTQDSYGTYMIMENSSRPFVVEIPGFRGYLSTRFSTFEFDWKAQTVFNYKLQNIAQVSFENYKKPKESFCITHANNHFELFHYPEMEKIAFFDTLQVKKYMLEFQKKNFSKYTEDVPEQYQDSIRQTNPMYVINVALANGTEQTLKAFHKPGWGRINLEGEALKDDPDNFFLLLDNNDFVYAQYFVFDPIFKELKDFIKKE